MLLPTASDSLIDLRGKEHTGLLKPSQLTGLIGRP
jgi:hypothetical protein